MKKVIGDIERDLLCCKCKNVLEDPVKTSCGHICCRNCIRIVPNEKERKRFLCFKCGTQLSEDTKANVEGDIFVRLEKISVECSLGCNTILPLKQMHSHVKTQCQLRMIACVNRGCSHQCPVSHLDKHIVECEYRLIQCEVCNVCICYRDMPAHQAVKKCYQQQLKSKRVTSARKLSSELKDHRLKLQQEKHLTDQTERKMLREHYGRQKVEYYTQRRRAQSATAVLSQSIQNRVGSALVVPRYSRTLSQTTPLSCLTCENKFLSGRRPSARRHSHAKVQGIMLFNDYYHPHFFFLHENNSCCDTNHSQ